ncbi:unnamed protein product [Soboliphyme baturini]|uniref:MOSC domain-containing protein n=1 Tax=Soboliphyme baturini TaxID=241478 RepID=A0A183J000_9BILA|nr:unnamed protein product [Soboliphyme baturini]
MVGRFYQKPETPRLEDDGSNLRGMAAVLRPVRFIEADYWLAVVNELPSFSG